MLISRRAALLTAALSACSPRPAARPAAITNSVDDDGDPAVVALVEGATVVCTASLIAPRLLVTAAHCIPDGALPEASFGAVPGSGDVLVPLAAARRHPRFDSASLANDIAVAVLATEMPSGVAPVSLPPVPLDASFAGSALRLVGFGKTSAGDTTAPRKRAGSAIAMAPSETTFSFAPSPSQTCTGDSGGPAFATVGGIEALVGITSTGDAACDQRATDTRVDSFATFLQAFVAATAAGAARAGERCWYAGNCAADAGECAVALDDAALAFCAPPCAAGCPGGLDCLAGDDGRRLCRHAPPSPGATGSGCSVEDDCASGRCVAPARGGALVCAPRCFADLPGFCSAGFECLPVAGGDGDACFPRAHGGGCTLSAGAPPTLPLPLVLAAALVAARRLRRRGAPQIGNIRLRSRILIPRRGR